MYGIVARDCGRRRENLFLVLVLTLSLQACGERNAAPLLEVEPAAYDFGQVAEGDQIEHRFVLRNSGKADLFLVDIEVDEGLLIEDYERIVPAGGEGALRVTFDSSGYKDRVDFEIVLETNDLAESKRQISFTGNVIDRVELGDRTRIYYFATREAKLQKAVVLSHPGVNITGVTTETTFLQPKIESWGSSGSDSLLTVDVSGDIPRGISSGMLELKTESEPGGVEFLVPFQVSLEEVVSVRPSELFFGRLLREDVDSPFFKRHFQVVRQQRDGPFSVLSARTTLGFVGAKVEPTEDPDRFNVFVTLDPQLAPDGDFSGELIIKTTDIEFSELRLPITGRLEAS